MSEAVDVYRFAPASALPSEVVEELLGLADDEFVIGHRHSEWLGLSPFLEEDLTLASIAQDELGHARALYGLVWPDWPDRDAMVTRRHEGEWRSCAFVERENGSWEFSFVRKWIYDRAETLRWAALAARHGETVPGLVDLVAKVQQEEQFHRRHAESLYARLTSSAEAMSRMVSAFELLVGDIGALVQSLDENIRLKFLRELADEQICGDRPFEQLASELGSTDGLSRRTRHVEFRSIAQSINDVVAFDPDATW